jgi:hypothetical protein
MAFLNFLTQGQPQASTSSTLTTSQVPQYLSDYLYNLMSGAYSAAQEEYQPYAGPRIAGFSPEQMSAFDMTKGAAEAYQPQLAAAGQSAQRAAGVSPLSSARPYFDMAAYMGASQSAQPLINAAASVDPTAAGSPYLNRAASSDITGAAEPYMGAAGQTLPGVVQNYMNPYEENVTNRMGDIAARQIREKLMPAMSDQFIRAGQFGSTRQQELAQRGVRDIAENLSGQIGAQLAQGYTTAGQQAQADLARMAGLGQTAGQLAGAQGNLLANIGQTAGSLANQRAASLGNLAQTVGQLSGQDLSRIASMGQAAGQIAGTEMSGLSNLAGVQAGLGQKEQALGLQGAAALEAVGSQQQQQAQKNLDLAYKDFLTQTQYPKEQISFLSNIIRGLPAGGSSGSESTVSSGQTYSASPLAQLASAGASASALSNLFPSLK